MSVAQAILNRVMHMPKGRPFVGAAFAQVGSRASVNKALSRLVQSGTLERVAHGVYMRPKTSKYTGTKVGVALTALHYLRKEGLPVKVASKIASALSNEELMKLQACEMPEWMRTALSFAAREMEMESCAIAPI